MDKKKAEKALKKVQKAFCLIDEAMSLLGIDTDADDFLGNSAWEARLSVNDFESEISNAIIKEYD